MRIIRTLYRNTASAGLVAMLVACGGNSSFDDLETNLDNPTGSITDVDAIVAADQERQSSGTATALGGNNFIGFVGAGDENSSTLDRFDIRSGLHPFFDTVDQFRGGTTDRFANHDFGSPELEIDDDCLNLDDNIEINVSNSKATAKFDTEVKLSDCTPDATGTLKFKGTFSIKGDLQAERIDSIKLDATYTFVDACETIGDNACWDGTISVRGDLADDGGDFGEIVLLAAWDLDISWDEDNQRRTETVSGGMRIDFSQDIFKIELSVTVNDSTGEPVSYTFELNADNQMVGFTIRGRDGSLTCTVSVETGAGSCEDGNGNTITWTEEDVDRVTASTQN